MKNFRLSLQVIQLALIVVFSTKYYISDAIL